MQRVVLEVLCRKAKADFQIDVRGVKVGQALYPTSWYSPLNLGYLI